MPNATTTSRSIGPWGTTARLVMGVALVAGALIAGVEWFDAVLGLLVLPLAVGAVVLVRGLSATPARLTGPQGHCINCVLGVAAFLLVPVAALLFYGGSMLVAAARGNGGCELFALPNWLWRRDDQIACPVFHVIDVAEHRSSRQSASG